MAGALAEETSATPSPLARLAPLDLPHPEGIDDLVRARSRNVDLIARLKRHIPDVPSARAGGIDIEDGFGGEEAEADMGLGLLGVERPPGDVPIEALHVNGAGISEGAAERALPIGLVPPPIVPLGA